MKMNQLAEFVLCLAHPLIFMCVHSASCPGAVKPIWACTKTLLFLCRQYEGVQKQNLKEVVKPEGQRNTKLLLLLGTPQSLGRN